MKGHQLKVAGKRPRGVENFWSIECVIGAEDERNDLQKKMNET